MKTTYFVYEDIGSDSLVLMRKFVTYRGAVHFAEMQSKEHGARMVVVEMIQEIVKEFAAGGMEVAA